MNDKQAQIDLLKTEKNKDKKLLDNNNSEINKLKEENKNLKIALGENREDIDQLNKKQQNIMIIFFKKWQLIILIENIELILVII